MGGARVCACAWVGGCVLVFVPALCAVCMLNRGSVSEGHPAAGAPG